MIETITWHAVADQLPDADETVLCAIAGADEPTWLGYYDGQEWIGVDALPLLEVTHWATMPEGPK